MTVAELIAKLSDANPEDEIAVIGDNGFETMAQGIVMIVGDGTVTIG